MGQLLKYISSKTSGVVYPWAAIPGVQGDKTPTACIHVTILLLFASYLRLYI